MPQVDDIAMTTLGFSGVLEAALYAEDLDAAEAFYGGLLALERLQRIGHRHVFYRVGSTILLIFNPHDTVRASGNPALPVPPHGAHGPSHLCLAAASEEIEGWKERLQAAGVAIEADFRWPNGARSIYFRDPAGNSLEIAEPGLWQ